MKIKLFDDAGERYKRNRMVPGGGYINWRWVYLLTGLAGMTLEVETKHLFQDQFNTAPVDFALVESAIPDYVSQVDRDKIRDGCALGHRIMGELVELVIDDARIGRMRCQWCGKTSDQAHACPKCHKTGYLYWYHPVRPGLPNMYALKPGQEIPGGVS